MGDGYLLVLSLLDHTVLGQIRHRLDDLVRQTIAAWQPAPPTPNVLSSTSVSIGFYCHTARSPAVREPDRGAGCRHHGPGTHCHLEAILHYILLLDDAHAVNRAAGVSASSLVDATRTGTLAL